MEDRTMELVMDYIPKGLLNCELEKLAVELNTTVKELYSIMFGE
jgi:hypothetical protein